MDPLRLPAMLPLDVSSLLRLLKLIIDRSDVSMLSRSDPRDRSGCSPGLPRRMKELLGPNDTRRCVKEPAVVLWRRASCCRSCSAVLSGPCNELLWRLDA